MNEQIGEYKDSGYIFDRYNYKNKVCFSEDDIKSYLEKDSKSFNIDKMKTKDDFIYEIISKDLDLDINEKIPNEDFTLGELIDCAMFYFFNKY